MKVKHLQAMLAAHDPETRIVVEGYEDGLTDITPVVGVVAFNVRDGVGCEGPHDEVNPDGDEVYPGHVGTAIIFKRAKA